MTQRTIYETLLFVGLVAAGAAARIYFQEIPNFAPVAAIALFSGMFFRTWWCALAVPLSIMVASDLVIGFYDGRVLALVYTCLGLPIFARDLLRRQFSGRMSLPGFAQRSLIVLGSASTASLLFFLVTNFGCWAWFSMYAHTWQGLVECYVSALPFFRATFAGDVFFTVLLFGGYALGCWAFGRRPVTAASHELA